NGFDKNPINLPVSAILEQTLKIVSVGCCRTGDGFIGIQSGKLPLLFGLDDVGIIRNLRGKGIELVGGIAAYSCISSNAEPFGVLRNGRDDSDFRHAYFPPS